MGELPPEEVVRRYLEGESMIDIALSYGTYADKVKDVLIERAVPIRPRGSIKGKPRRKYGRY